MPNLWENLNTTFKWSVTALALGLIVWGVFQVKSCKEPNTVLGPGLPVEVKPAVSENNPSVPAPAERHGGTLVIIHKPDSSSPPNTRPDTIVVQIPRDPRHDPPSVFADSGEYQVVWTPTRDPWAEILPTYHFGASIDPDGRLSPWFGFGVVRAFGVAYAGASVDASGGGLWVGWSPATNLSLDLSYRILRINSDRSSWSLSLAYTL
jgi:hypothetical protein